jgi:riboflavin synthase
VQGHVDTTAQLLDVTKELGGFRMRFSLPPEIAVFVAPKGSLALDGISLTIGEVDSESFSDYIVPHTWDNTTLHALQVGGRVNIETDCLAKYLFRMVQASKHVLPEGELLNLRGGES